MSCLETVRNLSTDPEGLERAYGEAAKSGAQAEFAEAIEGQYLTAISAGVPIPADAGSPPGE
jgi:hypothetical protein